MDFLKSAASKGFQALQELDEPTKASDSDGAEEGGGPDALAQSVEGAAVAAGRLLRFGREAAVSDGSTGLEASLEGAAGRFLSWTGLDAAPARESLASASLEEEEEEDKEDEDEEEKEEEDNRCADNDVEEAPVQTEEREAAVEDFLEPTPERVAAAGAPDSALLDELELELGGATSVAAGATAAEPGPCPPLRGGGAKPGSAEDFLEPAPERSAVAGAAGSALLDELELELGGAASAAAGATAVEPGPGPPVQGCGAKPGAAEEAPAAPTADAAPGDGAEDDLATAPAAAIAAAATSVVTDAPAAPVAASPAAEQTLEPAASSASATTGADAAARGAAEQPGQPPAEAASRQMRQELGALRAELEDARGQLAQRERQLRGLSEQLAERETALQTAGSEGDRSSEARQAAEKEATTLRKKVEALEKEKSRALRAAEDARERAALAEKKQKEDANDTERELLEHQKNWRERIEAAEKDAQEAQQEVEKLTAALAKEGKAAVAGAAAAAELDEARGELARLRQELEAQKPLEAKRAELEAERDRLHEWVRVARDVEVQLRSEISSGEVSRVRLQERCAELESQLESAQEAYSSAAAEVGALSSRLTELEFSGPADSSAEDALRQQLEFAKERCSKLEHQLSESNWMRDSARRDAEEARQQLKAHREADALKPVVDPAAAEAATLRVSMLEKENAQLRSQLEASATRQQEEVRRQTQVIREEVEYLKQKNDEKDRRLEVLICERNALRFESGQNRASPSDKPGRKASTKSAGSASATDSLPDLEEGLGGSEAADDGSARGKLKVCVSETDVVLRRFSRLLFVSPTMRRVFFGYVTLVHAWIWVVLHHTAAHHSGTHGNGST